MGAEMRDIECVDEPEEIREAIKRFEIEPELRGGFRETVRSWFRATESFGYHMGYADCREDMLAAREKRQEARENQ